MLTELLGTWHLRQWTVTDGTGARHPIAPAGLAAADLTGSAATPAQSKLDSLNCRD